MTQPLRTVGIIGAGVAGLAAADGLRQQGLAVTVFEKSRGVGGRVATRRMEDGSTFDHGAQYFTVRDAAFAAQVESWLQQGVVAPWQGTVVALEQGQLRPLEDQPTRYVGVPGMSAIAKALAGATNILTGITAEALSHDGSRWSIRDNTQRLHGPFDLILLSAPAPQTKALIGTNSPEISARLPTVTMVPCWSVMLQFDKPLATGFDGAFVHGSPLSWISRNSSKPQRSPLEAWVLHGAADWSVANLEITPDEAAQRLVEAFWQAIGLPHQRPTRQVAHRWRYALPTQPLPERHLLDRPHRLGVCGDWCGGPRVEGAYLSGQSLAQAILAEL